MAIKMAAMLSNTICVASTAWPGGPLASSLVFSGRGSLSDMVVCPLFPQVWSVAFAA